MRKILFPALVVILSGLFLLLPPISGQQEADVYQAKEGQLLLPQSNVAIVVLDLERAGLKFVSSDDHDVIRELQDDLVELPGAARIESILNTSRVIAEEDEIIVSRAVPSDPAAVDDEYLQSLVDQLPDFPELSPYISADTGTLLFYVYYSNRTPTIDIYQGLKTLQDEWADRLEFEFTGRAPILAETERLLTGDILIFLPILAVMVILIFGLFRQIKAMAVSIVLIILAMVFGYGMVRFAGIPDSPLILLIPVFGMGLLSDYLIHYLYHRFHTPSLPGQDSLRKKLIYPLSLTALSTVAGFVSLSLINGSGHLQLGLIVAVAVAVTWIGVFFWVDYQPWRVDDKPMFPGFQKMQGRLFARIARFRYVFFLLVALAVVWGASQLGSLRIEPYPIGQLPAATTIRQADNLINNDFYGTMPFFIEVDTGKKLGMLNKEAMLALDKVHQHFEAAEVGYAFSVLTVLKRMNYYFMGDEESLLTSTEFDDFYDSLIEQYLLYYSSSVDPLEYSSMLDSSYRYFSIKGLLPYKTYDDLARFYALVDDAQGLLPEGWTMSVHGMASQLQTEYSMLRNNWLLSFISGSVMIFLTVLIFYRAFGLALISLVPGIISMIISFGFISLAGIRVDAFSIIFVAIITGLVIDYSIHTLAALGQIKKIGSLEEGFNAVVGYSGIPIFLSFVTSAVSFSVLFLSSFSGARNLGFLLLTSLILSFFLSLYLIPLLVLPFRLHKEAKREK